MPRRKVHVAKEIFSLRDVPFSITSQDIKTSANSETSGEKSEASVGAQNNQPHLLLPMLNLTEAFADTDNKLIHPSLPIVAHAVS